MAQNAQLKNTIWLTKAFNLQALKKSRWHWVDYLKGIAILLVVYRHALIGIERSGIEIPSIMEKANMIFYSFRMPLFFILSGIFINFSIKKTDLNKLLFKKFENILYPYLIWAFLQTTIQIILSGYTNADRGWTDYLYILYQPQHLDQFWYLPALFNATVIFLFIRIKIKPPIWLHLSFGLVLYFIAPYFESVSMMSDWMKFYCFYVLGSLTSKLFFDDSTKAFFTSYMTLILTIPIFIALQLYYLNYKTSTTEFLVISLTGCFFMFLVAFRLQQAGICSFLRILGYHSLYIYVMHVMVTAFTRLVLNKLLGVQDPTVLLSTGIFAGIIVPIVIYNYLIRDSVGWFLFSLKKPVVKTNQRIKRVNQSNVYEDVYN